MALFCPYMEFRGTFDKGAGPHADQGAEIGRQYMGGWTTSGPGRLTAKPTMAPVVIGGLAAKRSPDLAWNLT
jgi:hypothetical protein